MSMRYFLVTGVPLGTKYAGEKSTYKHKWQRPTFPIASNYTFVTDHPINHKINIQITNNCNNAQMKNNMYIYHIDFIKKLQILHTLSQVLLRY